MPENDKKHESYIKWVESVAGWLREKLPNCESRQHQDNLIKKTCLRHRVSEKRVLELVSDLLMEG
jgi:hypothetical protein